MASVFETLNSINVNEHTEKKGNLTYLSWAWAWQEVKKNFPDAIYTIYENKDGLFYHTDGKTAWVKTGVTINGLEHIEYLPVMDYNNKSIALEKLTSFHVNTAIQRSLTKAAARHGLGLYIYAGEDLPQIEQKKQEPGEKKQKPDEKMQKLTERIDQAKTNVLSTKCLEDHVNIEYLCTFYNVTAIQNLSFAQWDHAIKHWTHHIEESSKWNAKAQ